MRTRLSVALAIMMALGSMPVAHNSFATPGSQDRRSDEEELRAAREQLRSKMHDLEEHRRVVRRDEEDVRKDRELIRKLEHDIRRDRR
jgi:hypothetical protein